MKIIRTIVLTVLCVWFWFTVLGVPPLGAQGPQASALNSAMNALLSLSGSSTQAYVARISASPSQAWNAGVVTFANAPQLIGGLIPNGVGQVTLPNIGPVIPTGSYTQDLIIPSGVPLFGNWNTGIRTTVNTYVDLYGNRVEAAVDPLAAFNYALTHTNYDTNQQSGLAFLANVLGQSLSGSSSSASGGGEGAYRLDPGLVFAFNTNYGQGLGTLFGVGVYVYETPTGVVGGQVSDNPGEPPLAPPSLPPLPVPTSSEEVYLKAVIPQPAPEFTLEFQPPFPVVVGQDPAQRGVDVLGRATLGACTVIWHHVLREEYIFCGKERCDCSKDACEIRVNTREWDTSEMEADDLASATVEAVLSPESVAYIQGELARIYPGARVYQGRVRVYASQWAKLITHHVGIPTTWAFLAERVPFADPGKWDFGVALTTTGTPHCAPLNWHKDFPQILTVWLREQRLIK